MLASHTPGGSGYCTVLNLKGFNMAKLGRRERLEKRERKEALHQLAEARKSQGLLEASRLKALPSRERNWLLNTRPVHLGLSKDALMASTHKSRLYIGRSMGSGTAKAGSKNKVNGITVRNPHRFLPAFMAKGHENLDTSGLLPKSETVLIKLPPSKKFRVKR